MVWIVHLTEELWYVLSIISNEYFANTKNTIPKRSRKHNTWVEPVLKPFIMKNQCSRHQTFRTRLQETRAVASGTRVHSRVSNRRFWWKKEKHWQQYTASLIVWRHMLFTIASASKGERYISQELIISILYLPTSHFPRRDQKLNTYDKQQVPDCATASRECVACNIIFHFYQKAERKGLLLTATD